MGLSHSAVVYVPSTQRNGIPVDNRGDLLEGIIGSMVDLCGGATVTEGRGYWRGEEGLAIEEVTLVTGYCQSLEEIQGELFSLCQSLAMRANQEAVSLALDNSLEFVGGLE